MALVGQILFPGSGGPGEALLYTVMPVRLIGVARRLDFIEGELVFEEDVNLTVFAVVISSSQAFPFSPY